MVYSNQEGTMTVSPADAVAVLGERLKRSQVEAREKARELRQLLPALVDILVREFRVTRVVLFGSLVMGLAHPDADIDLAVEGLAPEQYFRALVRCDEVADCHVDLVPLEEVGSELLRIIEAQGEVLHAS
jgi:uncharacterized protein